MARLDFREVPKSFPEIFASPGKAVLRAVRRDAESTLAHIELEQTRVRGTDYCYPVDTVATLMVAARRNRVPVMAGELSWATDLVMPASAINQRYAQITRLPGETIAAVPMSAFLPRIFAGLRHLPGYELLTPTYWDSAQEIAEKLRILAKRDNSSLDSGTVDDRGLCTAASIARTALRGMRVDTRLSTGVTSVVSGVSGHRMDFWSVQRLYNDIPRDELRHLDARARLHAH